MCYYDTDMHVAAKQTDVFTTYCKRLPQLLPVLAVSSPFICGLLDQFCEYSFLGAECLNFYYLLCLLHHINFEKRGGSMFSRTDVCLCMSVDFSVIYFCLVWG